MMGGYNDARAERDKPLKKLATNVHRNRQNAAAVLAGAATAAAAAATAAAAGTCDKL